MLGFEKCKITGDYSQTYMHGLNRTEVYLTKERRYFGSGSWWALSCRNFWNGVEQFPTKGSLHAEYFMSGPDLRKLMHCANERWG